MCSISPADCTKQIAVIIAAFKEHLPEMKYANIICVIHINNWWWQNGAVKTKKEIVYSWLCPACKICVFPIWQLEMNGEKTSDFKNKKHQTVLIIGLQVLNTVKNKRNDTVCTTGIKEWDMTDRTELQEAEIVAEIDETVLKRARWAGM